MRRLHALVLIPLFAGALACNNSSSNQHPSVRYEEKKTSLKDMEYANPLQFLKIKGDFHGNLVNQTVIEGEITNNATLVSYKDIMVQIVFKDKEGSTIERQREKLEDVIKPNSTVEFKIKTGHVKGVEEVIVDIVSASAQK